MYKCIRSLFPALFLAAMPAFSQDSVVTVISIRCDSIKSVTELEFVFDSLESVSLYDRIDVLREVPTIVERLQLSCPNSALSGLILKGFDAPDHPSVVKEAVELAAKYPSPPLIDKMIALYRYPGSSKFPRGNYITYRLPIAKALGQLDTEKSRTFLAETLTDPDTELLWDVPWALIAAMRSLGSAEFIEPLTIFRARAERIIDGMSPEQKYLSQWYFDDMIKKVDAAIAHITGEK